MNEWLCDHKDKLEELSNSVLHTDDRVKEFHALIIEARFSIDYKNPVNGPLFATICNISDYLNKGLQFEKREEFHNFVMKLLDELVIINL